MANKTLLCCAALCLFCSFAQAQEVDTTGFNALEYSMQKRWRPSNSEFRGDRFSDNLTLSLGGGVEQLLERSTAFIQSATSRRMPRWPCSQERRAILS